VHTTYGWIECVGHADRSAYDLQVHTTKSGVELLAREVFDPPRLAPVAVIRMERAQLGQRYLAKSKILFDYLTRLQTPEMIVEAVQLRDCLAKGPYTVRLEGESFEIDSSLVKIVTEEKKLTGRNYIPGVIEPSYGIGRILYAILEHSYDTRGAGDDVSHGGILNLRPQIAPIKVALLPLSGNEKFTPTLKLLERGFTAFNLPSLLNDSSISIGRRYARADEIGVPFCLTVDFESLEDKSVTIRDRITTQQIRVRVDDAVIIIAQLITETISWAEAYAKYPQVHRPEAEE